MSGLNQARTRRKSIDFHALTKALGLPPPAHTSEAEAWDPKPYDAKTTNIIKAVANDIEIAPDIKYMLAPITIKAEQKGNTGAGIIIEFLE